MRNSILQLLAISTLCASISAPAFAQLADTPSHRVIRRKEGQKTPQPSDFMTPEFMELVKKSRIIEQMQRQQRIQRLRNAQRSRQLSQDPNDPRSPVPSPAGDMATDMESVNRQLADRLREQHDGDLGKDLSETLNPNSIPFDPENPEFSLDMNNLAELGRQLRHEISRQKVKAQAEYSKAMRAYREFNNNWPSESIPPGEWLKKVQPHLNGEMMRQIGEVIQSNRTQQQQSTGQQSSQGQDPTSDTMTGDDSQTNPTDQTAPNTANSSGPGEQGDPSTNKPSPSAKKFMDSLIGKLDRTGTNWLKKSTKNPKNNSGIKRAAQKAGDWLSKLNLKVTEGADRVARRRANSSTSSSGNRSRRRPAATPPAATGGGGGDGTSGFGSSLAIILLVAAGLAAAVYFLRDRIQWIASPESSVPPVKATQITDRETLLRACNQLAHRCFGWPSRFWNHRRMFSELGGKAEENAASVLRLSRIYEHARYAPHGRLSATEVDRARKLFSEIEHLPA